MNTIKDRPNHLVVIAGSTGVGKTDFAQALMSYFPIEIINCDVGQFYEPLSIGTAKPDWKSSPIPHHFFDSQKLPQHVTIVEFRRKLEQLIPQIFNRGALPVIVGGSTFYIQSIFFSYNYSNNETQEISGSWQELCAIDPERAKKIHPHDTYRINRALTLWANTKQKPSSYTPHFNPVHPTFSLLFLSRPREQLYERINQRVIQMLDQGWLGEVRALRGTCWESFIRTKKIIGYDQLFTFCNYEEPEESKSLVIADIQQKTRAYAKKQETFWRMLSKKIEVQLSEGSYQRGSFDFVDLTLHNHDLYIKQLLKQIQGEH